MPNSDSHSGSIARLVLVPALITLGVTILRLVGELQHWSKTLFNPAPGGPMGLVGIVWLAPIFGIYFALKLSGSGGAPASRGKSIGYAVVALLVLAGGMVLVFTSRARPIRLAGGLVAIVAAVVVELLGWPSLGKALLTYGFLARIPVAIVMFFAMRGDWGTHYDALPPNASVAGFWPKYIQFGLMPQLIGWVAFTVVIGSLFGTIAAAVVRRGTVAAQVPL